MALEHAAEPAMEVNVENIGGIDDTSAELSPGVSVLTGRNATNRTSFLRAIMAAIGSNDVAIKGDADSGSAQLEFGEESHHRTLSRRQGTVVFDGDPYLDDPELADLFAFLLESNEARRIVERGGDLHDVIMRPVDTDQIETEIKQVEADRQELQSTLDKLDRLEEKLPDLEAERTKLQNNLTAKEDELESKLADLEVLEVSNEEASDIESIFDDLRKHRNRLEDVRQQIEDEERLLEALREDREAVQDRLNILAEVDEDERGAIEAELKQRRETIETIESTIDQLESVLKFNESILEESRLDALQHLHEERSVSDEGAVTDQILDGSEEIVCWTCGSQTTRDSIEETVSVLREVYSEKIDERGSLREEIDELTAQLKGIKNTREERQELRRELQEIEADLEAKEEHIEKLETEAGSLKETVSGLQIEVADIETDKHDERLELHQEINELEFELDRLESDLASVDGEIEEIEGRLSNRGELEQELETTNDKIDDLRNRIERLEKEAVEQFNEQMDTIIDLLEFDNLERIWIERVETKVRQGRRKVSKTSFDLHVIRSTGSGTVYEDTIDHLSESERELVGIVFALSGYLVHEVHELVPLMLLDSLEAFDVERLSSLIDYLSEQVEYLVVALLKEDAAAIDESYSRISEI